MNKIPFYYSKPGEDKSNRVQGILLDTVETSEDKPKIIQIVYYQGYIHHVESMVSIKQIYIL